MKPLPSGSVHQRWPAYWCSVTARLLLTAWVRPPFFGEGAGAFAPVITGQGGDGGIGFAGERDGETGFGGHVRARLGEGDGEGGYGEDAPGYVHRRGLQLVLGHDLVHEAEAQGLVGVEAIAQEDELLGFGQPDGEGQEERGTAGERAADPGLRKAEDSLLECARANGYNLAWFGDSKQRGHDSEV